tara:strand:- start:839 stop:1285 length:447 start_codon:yes stop_codon:yes gene_type:complete
MENNKKYFKKLIKNYLELRKTDYSNLKLNDNSSMYSSNSVRNINKYIKKLEETLSITLHNNINLDSNVRTELSTDLETSVIESLNRSDIMEFLRNDSSELIDKSFALNDLKKIITYIRQYCLNKIYQQFEKNLKIESKIVGIDKFIPT